ncbi:sulfate adenylyltransferase [uncultured Oscillibacter sp.]|uniref:sulfate adenylyltransferase n=1 Tax=uncultured Oscillibacter sp. TaxID=876091 RepID=UPI0025D6F534|nr:sulfate adenylyltransferase [uncultured Oscillibacter sp.]
MIVKINEETLQDVINIASGVLAPLTGFLGAEDFRSVVDHCRLKDGQVFPLPVTLDLPKEQYESAEPGSVLSLSFQGKIAAELEIESRFLFQESDLKAVFRTLDDAHPGVHKERERSPYRVGGRVTLLDPALLNGALRPEETRRVFTEKGWNTVVGFQTRNPIHKAHEHIQRIGLEVCDGLFINPLVGWKKKGDFTEEAVMAAYRKMAKEFYPAGRVHIAGLKTQMRYAGPREAVFHGIIRRNLGCTHFIIGRDHAGVGGYYGPYDAHALARELEPDLGIRLLLTREPYYCKKCGQIVTDKHCAHYDTDRLEISGTIIRRYIQDGFIPDELMLRREIFQAILDCGQVFIS